MWSKVLFAYKLERARSDIYIYHLAVANHIDGKGLLRV